MQAAARASVDRGQLANVREYSRNVCGLNAGASNSTWSAQNHAEELAIGIGIAPEGARSPRRRCKEEFVLDVVELIQCSLVGLRHRFRVAQMLETISIEVQRLVDVFPGLPG